LHAEVCHCLADLVELNGLMIATISFMVSVTLLREE